MKQRLLTLEDSRLYVVTNGPGTKGWEETANACFEGGADMLQLRDKTLPARELLAVAKRLKAVCDHHGALLIVDDRPDVALAAEAHGVHLGDKDLPLEWARRILGYSKIIGASAHSLDQALEAGKAGADYVSCGPLWATPTKPGTPAVGLSLVGRYQKGLRAPFFAIGGIDLSNLDQVLAAGARRVAVVRAVWNAPDPRSAAAEFRRKLDAVPVRQEVKV